MEQVESSVSYENACRLCLSTRGETQPIFSSGSEDQTGSTLLAEKIQECVSVEISESDGLSTQICTKCMSNVNNWHVFKKVCNYSQIKLRDWINGENSEESVDIKEEPLQEGQNDADIVIDASYPDVHLLEKNAESKLQPEGPPILASLGLAPRNEKENGEEDDSDTPKLEEVVRKPVKKTVMRPFRPLPPSQMASQSCLVCGRTYRYSHNARRHELITHNYDRYSNKIVSSKAIAKLRPNPLNTKVRLLPNPINQRIVTISPKIGQKVGVKNEPYPVKIRSLVDLQNRRQPQILKSLLTRKPEIMRSPSKSPETLISEPELAAYHVETIISEPDTYMMNNSDQSDGEGGDDQMYQQSAGEEDSEEEGERSSNTDVNKIIEVNGQQQNMRVKVREGSVERITPDDHDVQDQLSADEGVDPEDVYQGEEEKQEGEDVGEDDNEVNCNREGETYNEIDVDEHEVRAVRGDGENSYDEDDDDMPPVPLAPIVEINEGKQPEADNTNEDNEAEEAEESEALLETVDTKENIVSSPFTMTPAQKTFILKYRDVIEQVNTLKCKCCNKMHPRRKAVIQHLQKIGLKVPKHTCYNCVITFGSIGALLSHMKANICSSLWKVIYEEGGIADEMVAEGGVAPQIKVTQSNGREEVLYKTQYKDILNARSYACKLCKAKFQLKQMIMKHIIDVHENGGQRIPLRCVHCKYRFKDNKLWKKHVRNGECTVYIACELCNEKFRSIIQFSEHALSVHSGGFVDQVSDNLSRSVDGRPTDCHICQRSHSNYHNLVKHLKTVHNEGQPHMCQHCDSKFSQVSDLNHHIYDAHSDLTNGDKGGDGEQSQGDVDLSIVKEEVTTYNYSCTDCDAIFDSVDGWTQHQIDVHNHTAYECDMCDKKYLQDSELLQHKNEHLKVRFYSCTLCSNSYNSLQSLSDHMMESHPGEATPGGSNDNPFFCEMCQRSFKNRQAFSNHMRIHTNIPTHNKKPGELSGVKIKNAQPFSFNMVQRNSPKSLAGAPYSCDICGKGFLHKKNIWKHKKVLHPEEARRIEMEKTGAHFLNNSLDMQTSQNSDSTGLSIPQFDSFTTAVYEEPAQAEYQQSSQSEDKPIYQCDLCDRKFSVKSSIWKHKRVKHGIVNPHMQMDGSGGTDTKISCSLCKINFSDKKSYQRHKKAVHSVNCKICGIALSSTLQLYEHYKAAHAKELLGYNASQGSGVEESREGSEEGEEMYGEEEEENPEDKYQARYPCGDCGKTFVGMTALQEHDCQDGSQSQTFDCEICNKSYTSISALKSHRGWHLRSPDGKAAFNSSGLWMPQRQSGKVSKFEVRDSPSIKHSTPVLDHLEIKRKLPPDVQMTLLKKKKISDEVTVELVQSVPRFDFVEQTKKYMVDENRTCEPCGKQFSSKAGYMRHMDEVHRPNSIFCPLCSKSFTRKSTLLVHMRKHGIMTEGAGSGESGGESTPVVQKEVEKLYACDMCNVRYTTSKSLRRHRLKHHSHSSAKPLFGERPSPASIVGTRVVEVGGPSKHKCTQCNETFPSEKDLWQHSHYTCEQCPMVFSRQQYLSAHVRSRHQEALPGQFYPCSMCDRFYMNKKSLQRHIETSH